MIKNQKNYFGEIIKLFWTFIKSLKTSWEKFLGLEPIVDFGKEAHKNIWDVFRTRNDITHFQTLNSIFDNVVFS